MPSESKFADEYQVIKVNSQTYKYTKDENMCFFAHDKDTDFTDNIMFHSVKNSYSSTIIGSMNKRMTGEEYLSLDLFFDACFDIVLTGLFLFYAGLTFSLYQVFTLVVYLWIGKNIYWITLLIKTFVFIEVLRNKVKTNSSTIVFMGPTLTQKYLLSSKLFNFLSYCVDILVMCYCYQIQEYYFIFKCLLCGFIFKMCCKTYFYRYDFYLLILIVITIIGNIIGNIIAKLRGY